MDRQREPRETAYDVVVVGSGLGGLSAAAFLAKAGRSVLVLEQGEGPGGYAHAFRRGPYLFDPAVHFTAQGGEGALIDLMLRALGVHDCCRLVPTGSLYAVSFPGTRLHVPVGAQAFVEAHAAAFPREADGLRRLLALTAQVTRESQQLPPHLSFRELDQALERFPALFRHRTMTLGAVLDEYLADPHLKALCSASWPYVGLPPSSLTFFTWAAMLTSVLDDGPYYCMGSFQHLVDAFVFALERQGGEIVTQNGVERILVENGQVAGVIDAGGRQIRAPFVISNADARQTFMKLVGAEHLPSIFVRRLDRLEPSLSAFVAYMATTLDLREFDPAHETFIFREWDHEATYRDILAGRPGGMWVNVPTLIDPTLAPVGEHIVILTSLAAYDPGLSWDDAREEYTEHLLGGLEPVFPGFREHLRYITTATPHTLERYARNMRGATYGWSNTPGQATNKRPAPVTPVGGLYLAGHWTQPGTGSLRAMYSGLQAAQIILGCADPGALLGADGT